MTVKTMKELDRGDESCNKEKKGEDDSVVMCRVGGVGVVRRD